MIGALQRNRGGGALSAGAAGEACDQFYRELARWVGSDGCHALFARALADARSSNPALTQIQLHQRSDPYVQGIGDSVAAHGEPATITALESMLAVLVDLLRRLIGNDMAAKLIERSLSSIDDKTGVTTDRKQEEA